MCSRVISGTQPEEPCRNCIYQRKAQDIEFYNPLVKVQNVFLERPLCTLQSTFPSPVQQNVNNVDEKKHTEKCITFGLATGNRLVKKYRKELIKLYF